MSGIDTTAHPSWSAPLCVDCQHYRPPVPMRSPMACRSPRQGRDVITGEPVSGYPRELRTPDAESHCGQGITYSVNTAIKCGPSGAWFEPLHPGAGAPQPEAPAP